MDRELAVAASMEYAPLAERLVLIAAWGRSAAGCRELAARANQTLLDKVEYDGSGRSTFDRNSLAGNLAVIRLEQGRQQAAEDLMMEMGQDVIVSVIRGAYLGGHADMDGVDLELLLPTESARQLLRMRLSESDGDRLRAGWLRTDLSEQAWAYAEGPMLARFALAIVLFAVIVLFAFNHGTVKTRTNGIDLPWSVPAGLAAFAVVLLGLATIAVVIPSLGLNSTYWPLIGDTAVLAILWMLARRTTVGVGPIDVGRTRGRAGSVLLWAGVLIAIDRMGQWILASGLAAIGIEPPWWRSMDAYWIFSPVAVVLIVVVDLAVMAPAAEEVLFRGLLYPTLRRGAGILVATVGSAAIFGLVHPGVQGAAQALLLGIILAVGYERCRSLLPLIVCHGVHNLWPALDVILRYRV